MINELLRTMIPQGNMMRIDNAVIEDVSCMNNGSGSILVSYTVPGRNNMNVQRIRLNLNRGTVIFNTLRQNMCVCCLQRGMVISALISPQMTMSIPPQANAFLVAVQRNPQPQPSPSATTGRIVLVDFENRYILTENPRNWNDQTRFIITNATTFTNRFGAPIRFSSLMPGQMVRVTHANFQTASIPPQTTAFHVQLL
ncbi:hypothetical protein [Anaerolentibacter hominis]|uniref:hypothetical protein n=1 Tax=Anaerolentibacter hominis TaxID=3079009 RepID=UPI0031B8091D